MEGPTSRFDDERHHRFVVAAGIDEVADRLDAEFGIRMQNRLFDLLLIQCFLSR